MKSETNFTGGTTTRRKNNKNGKQYFVGQGCLSRRASFVNNPHNLNCPLVCVIGFDGKIKPKTNGHFTTGTKHHASFQDNG